MHYEYISVFDITYLKQTVDVSSEKTKKNSVILFWPCTTRLPSKNVPNPSMFQEPTRIELTPKKIELTVGESIVLSCKALHDSTLDVTFYWTLNGKPIDFEKEGGHFESIKAVSDHVFVICELQSDRKLLTFLPYTTF